MSEHVTFHFRIHGDIASDPKRLAEVVSSHLTAALEPPTPFWRRWLRKFWR